MGNVLWCCCKGEDDDDHFYRGADHYAYYYPASSRSARPHYEYEPAAVSSSPAPTSRSSSLLRFQSPPPAPASRAPQPQLHLHAPLPPVPHGVAVASSTPTSSSSLLRPQPSPAVPPSRPQQPKHPPVTHGVASSSTLRPKQQQQQQHPVPHGCHGVASSSTLRPKQQQQQHPVPHGCHGVASSSTLRPKQQQQQHPVPHGCHGVASSTSGGSSLLRLEHDLLNFVLTKTVPEGLAEHVTSSKKAQAKWYMNMSEAYIETDPPPRTSAEAAMLVATALSRIQGANLEGVLAFYGFAIPTLPIVTAEHHLSSLPEGVQFVLNTLPVDAKCIGDGDGFTAYVDTADPMEPTNVPLEVHEAVIAMAQARKCRNNQKKNELRKKLSEAGYRVIYNSEEEILARQYRFRLRGIDAPEMGMPYGKESQSALVKLIAGKSVMVYIYGQDPYKRYVGDIYCDGVFIQEQMLKEGHAWHYKIYDKRPEFAKWERKARYARQGLWASDNPEKPWDWKRKHNVRHEKTSDKLEKAWEWKRKTHQCET